MHPFPASASARVKIRYNAPIVLSFSLVCLGVFVLGSLVPLVRELFFVPGRSGFTLAAPLNWFRLVSYVAGHASWDHLLGNLSFILLLGPILEEKHGSTPLLIMMVLTALITGLINAWFFQTGLLGASGIVFMMILLVSVTNIRNGEVPLSFLLIAGIYVVREFSAGLRDDQIAQSAHLIGGACGSLFGFLTSRGSRPSGR